VCHWVSGFEASTTRRPGPACNCCHIRKKLSRTGYMAEVLMGHHQMALKIVVHWIQLAQDQSSGRSLWKQYEPSNAIKMEAICYLARRPPASQEKFCSMNSAIQWVCQTIYPSKKRCMYVKNWEKIVHLNIVFQLFPSTHCRKRPQVPLCVSSITLHDGFQLNLAWLFELQFVGFM